MTDATTWLPLTPIERRLLALHCIAKLYNGQIDPETEEKLKVEDLLMGTADATWSASTATGDAKFLPGQFKTRFEPARRPESDSRIFFAGEHLSHHHTWISGAAYSALQTIGQMLEQKVPPLRGFLDTSSDDFLHTIKGCNFNKVTTLCHLKYTFMAIFVGPGFNSMLFPGQTVQNTRKWGQITGSGQPLNSHWMQKFAKIHC
ncbi:hypothetical protein B0H11DRAFT_1905948 [Mycena galericulata]|nr:hypothetical protein B0H11DRAFT_1905948 [Mycena galericulata]